MDESEDIKLDLRSDDESAIELNQNQQFGNQNYNSPQTDHINNEDKSFAYDSRLMKIRVNINIIGGNPNIVVNNGCNSSDRSSNTYSKGCSHKPAAMKSMKIKKGMVSYEVAQQVAYKVGASWRRLGEHLGFEPNELGILKSDYSRDGVVEMCYRMITTWMEKNSTSATHLELGNALQKIECWNVVKDFFQPSAVI